ncbi:MAG: hypothetical protein KDD04_07965 [Sinomicrobium sp.]|nr:hypothetical protein [Sinomicrobium sp.]
MILWSLFLFVPFIARADDGFYTYLSDSSPSVPQAKQGVLFSFGDHDVVLQAADDGFKMPVEDKWAIKFNAGKDTVLTDDFSADVRHDRLPLDDGEREAFRFGVGLNYTF